MGFSFGSTFISPCKECQGTIPGSWRINDSQEITKELPRYKA